LRDCPRVAFFCAYRNLPTSWLPSSFLEGFSSVEPAQSSPLLLLAIRGLFSFSFRIAIDSEPFISRLLPFSFPFFQSRVVAITLPPSSPDRSSVVRGKTFPLPLFPETGNLFSLQSVFSSPVTSGFQGSGSAFQGLECPSFFLSWNQRRAGLFSPFC